MHLVASARIIATIRHSAELMTDTLQCLADLSRSPWTWTNWSACKLQPEFWEMCPNFLLHHIWQMFLDLNYCWSSGKLSIYFSGQKVKSLWPLFLEALYSAGGRWVPEPLKYGLWAFKLGIKVCVCHFMKNWNSVTCIQYEVVFLAQNPDTVLHICPVGQKIFLTLTVLQ